MKKKIILLIAVLVVVSIGLEVLILSRQKEEITEDKVKTTKEIDTEVNLDNGDEKINWNSLDEKELKLNNKSLEITNPGIYTLSGNISNGSITINTSGSVKLILDNVSIKNDDGPAIVILEADNAIIELKEDTVNTLEDSKKYSSEEYDGCIFSKDDLIFQGTGTLNVKSNNLDAIVSNDDLKIIDGIYNIISNDDGIRGKDSVYIKNGTFNIESVSDGIKSTNDTDQEKGYINIENGIFNINSGEDGIQAETKIIIYNGTYNVMTSDGSSSKNSAIQNEFYGGNNYDNTSAKALKANDNLVIKNGTFTIDSKDDAIHSNNYLGIETGKITISSGDDGIHADKEIIIDGGTIKINQSYEGIEASDVTINGGNINVKSNDDGINISGGNDNSSIGGRPGQNPFSTTNGGILKITGGMIYVDASGDGLDANGSITITGGKVYVDGPTNSGNGALDYDKTFEINGGEFIAVGASGMAQGASSSSSQYSLMFNISNYDGKITLEDSSNKVIFNYSPSKEYSSIVLSNDKLKKDEIYTLKIDGKEVATLKVDQINSIYGNSQSGMQGGNRPGGRPGRR